MREEKMDWKNHIGIVLVCLLVGMMCEGVVSADRGMIPTSDVSVYGPGQKAIIAWNGEEEVLILSTDVYTSENSPVLGILPLPSNPKAIKEGNFDSFTQIESLIQNKDRFGPGINITFHEKIGAHDITVVEVNDVHEFIQWAENYLKDHGIEKEISGDKLEVIVSDYIERGLKFFVFDMTDVSKEEESIEPIIYRFESSFLYYPLKISRLALGDVDIDIFAITNDKIDKSSISVSGLKIAKYYDGTPIEFEITGRKIKEISPEISMLFNDGAWLTALNYEGALEDLDSDLKAVLVTTGARPNSPPTNGILVPTGGEPQPAGTSITWVAYAEDPDGDMLYYRFWIRGPSTGNSWAVMQDWGTANTWTWHTSSADIEDTDISVWIRDGHHAPPDRCDLEKKYYDYNIKPAENKPPTNGILVPTRGEPQPAGKSITWVAYAEDPDGDTLYYRFWIKSPSTGYSWTIMQDWSTVNTWTWHTSSADMGNTDISVWIRDGHHASPDIYDLEKKYYDYTITSAENQPPINPSLTPDKPEPQPAGTAIEWTASATDSDGDTLYYRFWIKGPSTENSWKIMKDWSTDNTWTWHTTSADIGGTDISVWIRDGHHEPPDRFDLEKKCYDYNIVETVICKVQITYDPSLQDHPSIVYANGDYFVAYLSRETSYPGLEHGRDIFIKKFDSNWNFIQKVQVTSSRHYQDSPSLLFANNKLCVAYVSNEEGATTNDWNVILEEYDLDLSYINGSKRYLTTLQSLQDMPSLLYKDGYFYLAYQSWETGSSYQGDIYVKKFDSNWNQIKKVQVTSGTSYQDRPSQIYANGYFYVAYFSKETGNYDIFVKRMDANLSLDSWKQQITSESSSQSYPSLKFENNEYAIAYASNEGGTLGIFMKKYDSNWNFIEKTKVVDDSSAHERRPSMTYAQNDYWIAYVHNLVGSDDWNIFAIIPGCEEGPSPTPTPPPPPKLRWEITVDKAEYSPGDYVHLTQQFTNEGEDPVLITNPITTTFIAEDGSIVLEEDLSHSISVTLGAGVQWSFGTSYKLLADAPEGYYDVRVSISGGNYVKTVEDLFFVTA